MNKEVFMRKNIIILFVIIFTITFTSCKKEETILSIGIIIPFTGSTNYLLSIKKGIDLAVEEILSENLFNNKGIELHYIDSGGNSLIALESFEELEKEFHPHLYISVTSKVSTALAVKAEKYKAPIFCLVTADPRVSQQNQYMFSYYQTPKDEIRALLPMIYKSNLESIGVLYQDEEYGISLFDELQESLINDAVEIKGFPYTVTNPNIDNYIEDLKEFDSLYMIGYKSNVTYVLKKLLETDYKGILFGTSTFSDQVFLGIESIDKLLITSTAIYNKNYTLIKLFRENYNKAYKEDIDQFSTLAYDSIYLITQLINDEENINREVITARLSDEFVFSSLFGTIRKEKGKRAIGIPLHSAKVENNQLQYLIF